MTSAEPDGACPWCGLRAQANEIIRHIAYTHNPGIRRTPESWDYAGLIFMLSVSLALIAVAVVSAT